MSSPNAPAYRALEKTFQKLNRYGHLAAIAGWDQATMMPEGGAEARAEALAEIRVLSHSTLSSEKTKQLLDAAQGEPLDAIERASLREMRRDWNQAALLPESLVERKSLAGSRCEHAWREQRPANDWAGFLKNFEPVVSASREEGEILSQAFGMSRYDALMSNFEPGVSSAQLDQIFGGVKMWLPDLVKKAIERQANETVIEAVGPFPVEAQRELGLDVMRLLGFDFNRGRLDVSAHPFCGGVPTDTRITTVYKPDDFAFALMGVIHETGHARYEQALPKKLAGLPVGRARSMGLHESQSLAFEMQLGTGPEFLSVISPMLIQRFGDQAAFEPENLARLYTRVTASARRLDADELTYPAHIILRYEIERDLINGAIEARDIPALWDEKMMSYLGVDTRGDHANGAMQDIHWTDGSFGYFPSYTLGAMSAAQFMSCVRAQTPDFDQRVRGGDFSPMMSWLEANIWSQASRWETPDLMRRATGEELNERHFKEHLERRYMGGAAPELKKTRVSAP